MNRRVAERSTLPARRASVAVMLVFAMTGSLLGLLAAGDNVLSVDVSVLKAVQRIDIPGLDGIVRLANAGFDTVPAAVLGIILLSVAAWLGLRAFALQMAIVMILRVGGQVLKPAFESPRPGIEYQPDPSVVSSTFGYPSGHAYTATIMMVMFVVFVHAFDAPRWVRIAITALAVIGVAVAMFSRVRVGAHWPTDTVGGVCFGLATVALMQIIAGAILDRRGHSETPGP